MRLSGADAEDAARVIEHLFVDLADLRLLRDRAVDEGFLVPVEQGIGGRTDVAAARVTLLNVLSIATEGDLMGEDMTEERAKELYLSLHHHGANGYERGDCHCDHCDNVVNELVVFFEIEKPSVGVYSPASLVQEEARRRGWEDSPAQSG